MKPRPRPHLGLFDPDPRLPAGYWRSLAPGTERVEIEIGSGDGGFLLGAARQDPRTLFVGFENRPGRACKIGPGPNVKVLELDARWVVSNILAAGSIDAFHVYFPDPWWKKRHHKRRLFTDEFCAGLRSSMSAEAKAFLMTDVESQFADIDQRLHTAGLERRHWARDDDATEAMGSYERKYRRQGRRLYQASYAARPGSG